ncbi:unnamed protein product [Closterium sp. NIES-54]
MVGAVGDTGVVDTLEAWLKDARRRHEANEYGPNLSLAVIEAGIRSVWAEEHPARPASPRPVNNKGGFDVGVNAAGDQVGSNAGGTSRQRGVIHADEVGSVQAQGMWSSAAAGTSQGDVGGQRSSLSPMPATHVIAGRIALSYGYFKLTPDRITVTPLLVGRPDILTLKEAIEPPLEMAGLVGFARGTVATPEEHYPDLHAEFRAVQLLTFTVISRCCSSGVQIALKSCKEYLDAGHRAWHFIESTYQVTDALYIGQLEEQLSHIRMGEEETAADYCNRARRILASMRMASQSRKEKQSTKSSTSVRDTDSSAGGKGRHDKEASCSLVGVVEPTVSLVPEVGEDFQAQANPVRQRQARARLQWGAARRPGPRHCRSARGGREAGAQPDVLYVPGMRANPLSAGQWKENGVKLQEDGDGMLLISAAGDVLGRASYTGRVLCTNLRPCSAKLTTPTTEVVALRAIVSVTKLTPDRLHARLAHIGMNTIRSSAKHEVATGLDLKSALGADLPCVSCVGGKLARHTFPDQGSDANDVLAVVHVNLCDPFRVAAKDGSLYFLLLKDRKTRYVWVRPVTKSSDALQESVQWLAFNDFMNGKGIVYDLTCPYTPQQNGMAEREMRTVVESVRTMLLHMGVQHHWWHLALRQAVWVHNCLERSTSQPGTTPYPLLTRKKPDLSLARVWGCMAQFLVPEQQRGGKLEPKARWGLHLGMSEESKGWELLDIADDRVVTTSDMVFYENMSLEEWKLEHGPASGRTPTTPPTDASTATLPLLAEVGEPAAKDIEDDPFPSPSPVLCAPPLVIDLRGLTLVSASSDEGRSGTSPSAPAKSIAGGRRDEQQVDVGMKSTLIGEEQAEEVQPTLEKPAKKAPARQQPTGEQAAVKPTTKKSATMQLVEESTTGGKSAGKSAEVQQEDEGSEAGDDGGDAEESTDSDVVEVQRGPRQSSRIRRPPDFYVPAAFTTAYDEVNDDLQYYDAKEDEGFPELKPDMHVDPERCWDISTMTMKEALASWKGKAVKAAMEEEIHSLVSMGTLELVECPPVVNIMKNRSVLTTKYHINDTIEHEKVKLVVKDFTQVYGADYDETYAPNAFLQSKLDRVLYMYQPNYFNDGTSRVCKLLKSLYGLKQSPLLWYSALDGVLLGAGLKKSQVDAALYFKVGDDKVTCWVLVFVDDLLAASSSAAMLKVLKELLKAAFELWEILPVQKYLGLEIVRDRSVRKLWLHQQGYTDKLHRRFLDKEQNGHTPKTPFSVDAYATLIFDDKEAHKLGSGLIVRSNQHWREVDCCLAYLANTRDTALEFGGGAESLKLVGYVDTDDAGDKQNRTSTGGYVFVFGGAAVSWSSQRIKFTTLSLTESEYVAATEAGKEGRRLRFLLAKFQQLEAGTPTVLRVDNKSAITVAEGMGLTSNLKHMERRQAWLQHMVKREKISLRYIPTAEQPADFLTKALHYPAFNRCSVAIGQVRLVDVGDSDNDVQQ